MSYNASGHSCSNTLGEEAKVVDESVVPDVLVWTFYEVAVFQGVAGRLVDDRVGRAWGVVGYKGDRWLGCAVGFGIYQEARWVGVAGACGGVIDRDVTGCNPGY